MKTRTAQELAGMTVNERLYATDQFDEHDEAVASHDEAKLRTNLEQLHIGETDIVEIIEKRTGRSSR